MINVETCKKYINDLLNEIYYSQFNNFVIASNLVREVSSRGGRIFFLGQGHSVWVGKDVVNEYGLNIIAIDDSINNSKDIYDTYKINNNDLIFIVSNSGINDLIIDFALYVKEKGNKLVTISSYKHSFKVNSKHISKKKLYELADVSIDNCCTYGDAAIKGKDNYVGSFSAIANNTIVHTILYYVDK